MRTNHFFQLSRTLLVILCTALSPASLSAAESLPAAEQAVVLTVTGNIERMNGAGKASFDLAMLDELPQHSFYTETPWTERKHHFSGVLMSDLLGFLEAKGETARVVALNDYHFNLDMQTAFQTPLLLTTRMDGKVMKIRNKGPIWLMLPLSDKPEYDTKEYHEMLVWQLKELNIE